VRNKNKHVYDGQLPKGKLNEQSLSR